MSKTASAELSLINDSEFLDELQQFEAPVRQDEDFASLEAGLPMAGSALEIGEPFDEGYGSPHVNSDTNPYDEPMEEPALLPEEKPVPLIAAALILAVCMSAGAATAAYVFHDQLTRIIAPRAASR